MDVKMGEDGHYHVVLTKAEGHLFIWDMRAWNMIRWELKKKMVAIEDDLDGETFDAVDDEAMAMQRKFGYRGV